MKQVMLTFCVLAFLGCKNNNNSQSGNTVSQDTNNPVREVPKDEQNHDNSPIYTNNWTTEIQLNNGEKWEADATTNNGAQQLENAINSMQPNSIKEYHELAKELNEVKNFLVKNCSMTGPAHDNLHIWLHPLIDKINALLIVDNLDDAKKLEQAITVNIEAYTQYFN
ncbi:hypothetical protein ACFSQP_03365 [Bizionia sediminis]|uniref:Uncharacterized protein n=1 Tax=Bizionia sediminis TaxID=1737064 RepID=A0ABW5KQF2_9FLAO